MDDNRRYEAFVRNRITELREQKGVSEHRMSLELGKSGSYIRSITNGRSGFPAWDHRQEAACPAG